MLRLWSRAARTGRKDPRVVAFCAGLSGLVKMDAFAKKIPEHFFRMGIAEANITGFAYFEHFAYSIIN